MPIELLLARLEDGQPVLPGGIEDEALAELPIAPLEPPSRLWDSSGGLDDLARQRWGLVIPQGPEGERLLSLVAPLRAAREAQQGAPARVYVVPTGLDAGGASRWKKQVFRHDDVPEEERPRYLLVLGDLDLVSLELQQALSTDAFVGRLAFASDVGYANYVSKVLRWEGAAACETRTRLLFYTARDDSSATRLGHRELVEPCLDTFRRRQQAGALKGVEARELRYEPEAPERHLLEAAAEPGPAVLLSVSHGACLPEGEAHASARRSGQGALILSRRRRLEGADLATGPFLAGGMWFCFACFSAGTPARGLYTPFLRRLATRGSDYQRVLSWLATRGEERPFIAALPQAALANPEGPLAVMGHVDLAWSCGFIDRGQRTSSRFWSVLRALALGHRAGNAMRALLDFFNDANMELTARHAQDALRGSERPSMDAAAHAYLWLQRQDLMAYVLLGDPAARLPHPPSTEEA
ncbi:hypothetical protein CYFUS_000652 [Cystobacter fuscus]|uniref:Gingipain domain-containing protein n=1 Tax=Cystobacter fuscus TaxID=43 RepID=A0A250IVG0_9BACT|nr:hypothetical protein [Cystobacter fuscus]ATB35240.1 hypothetical protein CYFUS_000652 [Cystobacter fuscus]